MSGGLGEQRGGLLDKLVGRGKRLGVVARRALERCERVGDDRLTVVVLVFEGRVRERRGDSVTQEQQIAFGTAGLPPVKNEAKSLLAANHPHADRVRALLQAARTATDRPQWAPFEGDVGLEVVVRGPHDRRWRSDATNVLGGIGDVLQRKQDRPGRVDLSHLGTLAGVALYHDDQQIRQVRYREERASVTSYTTRVWALPPAHQEPPSSTQTPMPTAAARGRRVLAMLVAKGAELGFDVQREYPVQGGRLDLVWLLPAATAMPGPHERLPVVGFEVESSWRTRKHLKGDWLNLHDLQ